MYSDVEIRIVLVDGHLIVAAVNHTEGMDEDAIRALVITGALATLEAAGFTVIPPGAAASTLPDASEIVASVENLLNHTDD